jgi:hypothetical protein
VSGPYRTAPPAEWPRSLRAAFLLGYKAPGSSILAPVVGALFSLVAGLLLGGATMRAWVRGDTPPPTCDIEATWNPLAYRGAVTLSASRSLWFDKTVAYLPDIDAALATAEKIGCKVVP